jgi:hypothetical protein
MVHGIIPPVTPYRCELGDVRTELRHADKVGAI